MNVKFVHTNLIARNWKSLASFYTEVFGCIPIYPERKLAGEWLEKLTELNDARIEGIHLQLPGYENGPTLEIFEYKPENQNSPVALNAPGFGHIAFHVDDVSKMLIKIVEHGGAPFGELVKKEYAELNSFLTISYARDPEGNFIELQNWQKN
jgi:predicted enzyme related to lactoylglutathione lyase